MVVQNHTSNTDSLLNDIIGKLEKTNLMQEKLALLRKMQKKREKKHILSERIESETSGTEVIAAAQQQQNANHAINNANGPGKKGDNQSFRSNDNTMMRPPSLFKMTPNTMMN